MKRPRLTAVQAFDQVLAEVKAGENNAIDTGKPTMWAYFADMVDALEAAHCHFGRFAPADNGNPNARVIREMRSVLDEPQRFHEHDAPVHLHDRTCKSRWASLQVYATRVLRLAGERVPHRSLDWLREQKRWP